MGLSMYGHEGEPCGVGAIGDLASATDLCCSLLAPWRQISGMPLRNVLRVLNSEP